MEQCDRDTNGQERNRKKGKGRKCRDERRHKDARRGRVPLIDVKGKVTSVHYELEGGKGRM